MWKTGHSFIKQKMKEMGAPLAGEMSGHMFFGGDWYGFDDALFAAARLLAYVAREGGPLSRLLADLPKTYATPEMRVDCPDEEKFAIVQQVAVETAERAWDRTFAGGEALIAARDLARLLQALVLLVAITWMAGNLLIVYRAIGSVQMPRRLGDLEIVEAVPRRTLLAGTVLLGVILGSFLSLGAGDWWRHFILATSPPHFGVPDSTKLGHDAGYYVSVVPWLAGLQNRTLILVV